MKIYQQTDSTEVTKLELISSVFGFYIMWTHVEVHENMWSHERLSLKQVSPVWPKHDTAYFSVP